VGPVNGSSTILEGSGVEDLEDDTEVVATRRDVADRVYSRVVTVSDGPGRMPFWTMGFGFLFFPGAGMVARGGENDAFARAVCTYLYLFTRCACVYSIQHDA